MAWTYLAVTAELLSHSENGSGPSLIVKSSDTLREFFSPECPKDDYPKHLFGTISTPSLQKSSEEKSMSSTEDFHAPTSARPTALQKVWKESEVAFSSDCVKWSNKSSPLSSSWKTCLPLEQEVLMQSPGHFQIWGMIADGLVYLPRKLEPVTTEKGGSYWPTPAARDMKGGYQGGRIRNGKISKDSLDQAVQSYRKGGLVDVGLNNWTTKHRDKLEVQALNPQWVEQMMGLPVGWTELKPSVTGWYRTRSKQPSKN
jgi:hypothetical protein